MKLDLNTQTGEIVQVAGGLAAVIGLGLTILSLFNGGGHHGGGDA